MCLSRCHAHWLFLSTLNSGWLGAYRECLVSVRISGIKCDFFTDTLAPIVYLYDSECPWSIIILQKRRNVLLSTKVYRIHIVTGLKCLLQCITFVFRNAGAAVCGIMGAGFCVARLWIVGILPCEIVVAGLWLVDFWIAGYLLVVFWLAGLCPWRFWYGIMAMGFLSLG